MPAAFNAIAVIRALNQPSGDGQMPGGRDRQGMAPSRLAMAQPASSAFKPAALAQLLTIAPQTVPFARRVEVFRALIAADRVR